MNPEEISEPTLRTLRDRLDISQEELGRRLHLSYRTIAEWESQRKMPRFDNAVALARELGVSLKELAKAMHVDISGLRDDVCPCREEDRPQA